MLRTTLIRLGFAAFLSLAGLFVTFKVSEKLNPGELHSDERRPIAHAIQIDGEHKVKHEGSKIATNIQEGEPIFKGDTVRTGERGGLKIKFPKGDLLELEADTTIIFTINGDHVVLGLMDGYVQATAIADGSTSLQVQTTNGQQVALKKNVQLSNDGKSGIQITSKDTAVATKPTLNVKWVTPLADFEHALNAEDPVPYKFKWTGGLENQKVLVQWGSSRKKMTNSKVFPATATEADIVVPIGNHFWRWVVMEDGKEDPIWTSPTSRAIIRAVNAPAVIGPVGKTLLVKTLNEPVELKWTENDSFEEYRVEVAKDKAFKDILINETLTLTGTYPFQAREFGAYYWRVSGKHEKDGWLKGKANEFSLKTKELEKAKVKWVTKIEGPIRYSTTKPSVTLAWQAEPIKVVKGYRLRVAAVDDDLNRVQAMTPDTPEMLVNLDGAGKYQAIAEAINEDKEVIGKSPILTFEAKPIELLRAPAMVTPVEEPIRADSRGTAQMAWEPLNGAKEYTVEIKDPEGKPQTHNSKSPMLNLNKLMPGQYEVRLSAIDNYGRPGQKSDPYRLIVPNKSAIKLKVKKVEVR